LFDRNSFGVALVQLDTCAVTMTKKIKLKVVIDLIITNLGKENY